MYVPGSVKGRLLYAGYAASRPLSILLGSILSAIYRSGALARHFLFQVIRDAGVGRYVFAQGRETFIVTADDDGVGREVYATHGLDFDKFEQTVEIMKRERGARDIDLLLDVGANIGTISIPAVKRGLAQRVLAFEPERENFKLLTCNILLNDAQDRIATLQTAVGDAAGQIEMEICPTNGGDNRIRATADPVVAGASPREVQIVPIALLDDLLDKQQAALTGHSLIWMDIQGYEAVALRGARRHLQAKPMLAIEFWPGGMSRAGTTCRELKSLLSPYFSAFYDLRSPSARRSLDDLETVWDELGLGQQQTDIVFV